MAYIGKSPTAAPLTSSDVADDIITLAKMAGGTDGNIITYDASGNPAVVATGNDGQVLTSTGAGSPPAFEAISGGKILQVVSATDGSTRSTTSTTFVTGSTTLTLDITPAATSSKVLIMVAGVGQMGTRSGHASYYTIFKGGSNIVGNEGMAVIGVGEDGSGYIFSSIDIKYIDSPSTTSQITYDVRMRSENGSYTASLGAGGGGATDSIIIAMEIGA